MTFNDLPQVAADALLEDDAVCLLDASLPGLPEALDVINDVAPEDEIQPNIRVITGSEVDGVVKVAIFRGASRLVRGFMKQDEV